MEATRIPLDFDTMDKGSTVPVSTVEAIVGCDRSRADYALGAMRLCQEIGSRLRDRGIHAVVKLDGGAVRVLTDEEAVAYTAQQRDAGFRKMVRAHDSALRIDRTQLSESAAAQHERQIIIGGRFVAAAVNERREAFKALPYTSTVPRLTQAPND